MSVLEPSSPLDSSLLRHSSTGSSNYPLVCPVTAVPSRRRPVPREHQAHPSRVFPSASKQVFTSLDPTLLDCALQPSPLVQVTYEHSQARPRSASADFALSDTDTERALLQVHSLPKDRAVVPLPNFTLPAFLGPSRSSKDVPLQSCAIDKATITPVLSASNPPLPLTSEVAKSLSQSSISPLSSSSPRRSLDLPSSHPRSDRRYPVRNCAASAGFSRRRIISLAELERRLSVASLPTALEKYISLIGENYKTVKEDKSPIVSGRAGYRNCNLRRQYSSDSLMLERGWWDTFSMRSWNSARQRPMPRRTKMRRHRDDVDWSTIASTEEESRFTANERSPRFQNRKRVYGGSSMYPPIDRCLPALLPVQGMLENQALSPVASRSLLTCNSHFKKQYPFVYQGLCKGILDIQRLIAHEIVVPIKEDVSLRRSTIRSRKAVTNSICDQLWRSLQGKFPDPSMAPKLIKKIADYFYDKIEYGIQDAEDERSFLQWLFRFDVENAIDLRQNTTIEIGKNSALCNVEGSAHLKRKKGDFFNMVSPDVVTLNIECVIKVLFLNGGHLLEINSDSRFIDRVSAGENRFARSFLM